jgi:UDP-2,3-diacylglucosamine hydrolase
MALFSWAKPKLLAVDKNLAADQRIYFISDLHLGDGTRSDCFMGKDTELMRLIEQIQLERAHLVIVGDAIDLHQAWWMSRVIKAHARLMRSLSLLANDLGVTYIWGNHDFDISLFRDLLQFDVCSRLTIDDVALVQHGYEYDPFIGPNLDQSHVATRVHHFFERMLDSWIRLPLENFYNMENRVTFWCFHKAVLGIKAYDWIIGKLKRAPHESKAAAVAQHWAMNQIADPANLFENVRSSLEQGEYRYLVTGHSHLPGRVQVTEDKVYINTGSWTFNSAQYAVWDGKDFTVHDWMSGKTYQDAAYRPLVERRYVHMDFMSWWRENYLGWLRFRVGEEGRMQSVIRAEEAVESESGSAPEKESIHAS